MHFFPPLCVYKYFALLSPCILVRSHEPRTLAENRFLYLSPSRYCIFVSANLEVCRHKLILIKIVIKAVHKLTFFLLADGANDAECRGILSAVAYRKCANDPPRTKSNR
jgi:hypothetical protein